MLGPSDRERWVLLQCVYSTQCPEMEESQLFCRRAPLVLQVSQAYDTHDQCDADIARKSCEMGKCSFCRIHYVQERQHMNSMLRSGLQVLLSTILKIY